MAFQSCNSIVLGVPVLAADNLYADGSMPRWAVTIAARTHAYQRGALHYEQNSVIGVESGKPRAQRVEKLTKMRNFLLGVRYALLRFNGYAEGSSI